MHLLSAQYELVKESREVIFEYCEHFSRADYVRGLENFNGKSVRDLQVHVANTYLHWLLIFGLQRPVDYFKPDAIKRISELYETYKYVNAAVSDFIAHYQHEVNVSLEKTFPGKEKVIKTSPLQLMTHVMTHEFHHKGQILSMGRIMGYIPPDADVIRG